LRLVHLGVDLAEHAYDPRPAPVRPRFVFIGRLVEKKGAEFLVRAMARLVGLMKTPAELEIIGGGPLEGALRELVVELGLSPRVTFAGPVPFHQLFERLRGATALVQPSVVAADGDSEGAPMVLMHAQASGVPCVTTAHTGNPEVLPPEGQRFVVPERDADALARAMLEMATLDARQRSALQAAGRAWIEREFDLLETVRSYDALYRELLGRAG
jgi:glycosyltransferase involved in cell wall biosynthesis